MSWRRTAAARQRWYLWRRVEKRRMRERYVWSRARKVEVCDRRAASSMGKD